MNWVEWMDLQVGGARTGVYRDYKLIQVIINPNTCWTYDHSNEN